MGFFMSKYSKFEKTLPDVSGKVFAITGTTSGTGFVAAKTVAAHGGEVLLLNRPSSRSVASLEKLKEEVPDGKFVPIDCDLQSLASVRSAGKAIKSKYTSLYCLSNNAGIMATPDEITSDGYDKQMQTNHLSHFLLTKELFPLLLASAKEVGDARIVQHSSLARNGTLNQQLEEKYMAKYEKDGMLGGFNSEGFLEGAQWARYSQTKLANSVFNQALNDKMAASSNPDCAKVLSTCAHPGWSATNLADDLGPPPFFTRLLLIPFFAFIVQTPSDGAMGLLKGMMDVRANLEGGGMYGPENWGGCAGYAVALPSKPYETDQKSKDMLWKMSEQAIGGTFDI